MGCLIAAIDWDWLQGLLWQIFAVAMGLGFVIFVHELGHFLVAKLCGVKCEKFYVGFDIPLRIGPLELSRFGRFQWGETEYGIGILPLGGYVKMLGQDDDPRNAQLEAERIRVKKAAQDDAPDASPDSMAAASDESAPRNEEFELDPRSFPAKPVPHRMAIISAGVIMNLIFAVLFATFAFSAGVPYTPCVIGGTVPGSPAWQAGLVAGSKIVQIGENGRYSEKLRFDWDLSNSGVGLAQDKEDLPLLLRTPDGQERQYAIRPVMTQRDRAKIPMIGVARANTLTINRVAGDTPAGNAEPGFETGDRIVAVNGVSIQDAYHLQEILARDLDKTLTVSVDRQPEDKKQTQATAERVDVAIAPNPIRRMGLVMQHGPITVVQDNSPADQAGFQVGDRLEQIDGQPLGDPLSLPAKLRAYYGREVVIQVQRNGQPVDLKVAPQQPKSFGWSEAVGFPMAADSIGIAFQVTNTIEALDPAGPAATSGLQAGDQITSVRFGSSDPKKTGKQLVNRGRPLKLSGGGYDWMFVVRLVQSLPADTVLQISFQRPGETADEDDAPTVDLKPEPIAQYSTARGFGLKTLEETYVADTWSEALTMGWRQTWEDASKVLRFLKKLVTGEVSATNLGGPISIAVVAGSEASQGIPRLLIFLTFLSANLAVLNFLPIPALDGGHMIFLLAEGVRGKPVDERMQMALTLAGVACLLCLMVFVFGLDIHRLFF